MTATSVLARPMLAGLFVYSGAESVRDPKSRIVPADKVAPAIARKLGLPEDTEMLVRINGGVQVVAGVMLATGKLPRVASLALAATLVPTTAAGHRFWEEQDPSKRHAQQVQFLKNTAMFGGLLLAAADTGGRPSVTWWATRKARRARGKARRATKASRKAVSAGAAGLVPGLGAKAATVGSAVGALGEKVGTPDVSGMLEDVAGGLRDVSTALQAFGRDAADALADAAPKAKVVLADAAPKAKVVVASATPKAKEALHEVRGAVATATPKALEALHEVRGAVATATPKALEALR